MSKLVTASKFTPHSYVFRKSGSTYYCTNGLTGAVTSSTNINTVLQACLNGCINGDSVYFKPGSYGDAANYIDVSLPTAVHGINFLGSGLGNDTLAYGGSQLNIAAGGGFDISDAADEKWYTHFSHLIFAGGGRAAAQGIYNDSQMTNKKAILKVDGCLFVGFGGAGSHCISLTNHELTIIKDSWFRGCPSNGEFILLKTDDYYAGNARIQNNYFNTDAGSTGMDCIHIVTANSKENDMYLIEGNHFLNTAYPGYMLNLNAASGKIKYVYYAHNRCEYANHIRCEDANGYVESVFIHDNYLNPDSGGAPAIRMPTHARSWNIHNNTFNVDAGRVGILDESDESTYPSLIMGNNFYGAGTYIDTTGAPHTVYRSNNGVADT